VSLSIINGRLIDPAHGIDDMLDVHIDGEQVVGIGHAPAEFAAEEVIDARDCVVCPGLVDLAASLREPGYEHKATLASEAMAAARSGITTLICTPDTSPVIDNTAVVELIHRVARKLGLARILTTGALTRGLAGEQLSEMAALQAAGCVAVGNARQPLASTLVERRALEYAATFDLAVFLRPEDRHLRAAVVHTRARLPRAWVFRQSPRLRRVSLLRVTWRWPSIRRRRSISVPCRHTPRHACSARHRLQAWQ